MIKLSEFDRTAQVKKMHEIRRQKTADKVNEGIKRLIKKGKDINFNSVSEESGVSKATLYNTPEIRERIESLRDQQEKEFVNIRIKRDEKNQNVIIESLKRKIEKLEAEVKRLEKENRKLKEEEKADLSDYFSKI